MHLATRLMLCLMFERYAGFASFCYCSCARICWATVRA